MTNDNIIVDPQLIDATFALLISSSGAPMVIPALNRDGDILSDLVLPLFGSIAGSESLLVAFGDHLVPSDLATAAFGHAHEPKRLIVLPGGHFDAYVAGFAAASGHARDWFVQHLA